MFPLFSQAAGQQNLIEQQLQNHILSLTDTWKKSHGIKHIKPQLRLRSSRQVKVLENCATVISFTKKSDKLLGIQQWQATCPDTDKPAVIRSQLSIKALLPVPAQTLSRGHVINAEDLIQKWVNYPNSQIQVITSQSQLIGKRVKHKLRRLRPIQVKQLVANIWVAAGEHVIIEASTEGFSANMKGKALQSGGEGQAIKVRNLSSGKVILAYPIGKGKVKTRF